MKFFDKSLEKVAKISFPMVDVRDVAQAVPLVLSKPIASGKRYLIVQGSYWMRDIMNILRVEFEKYGYSLPKKTMSNFYVWLASWWNPVLSFIKPYLEGELIIDTSLFINEIAMPYRKIEETFIDFCYDLIKKKMIEDKLFFIGDDRTPRICINCRNIYRKFIATGFVPFRIARIYNCCPLRKVAPRCHYKACSS